LRRLVGDGVWLLHPKEELGRLAGGERVEYLVEYSTAIDGVNGEGEGMFGCRVLVGGECLGVVEGCGSRLEARTRAAEVAWGGLRGGEGTRGEVRERGGDGEEVWMDKSNGCQLMTVMNVRAYNNAQNVSPV